MAFEEKTRMPLSLEQAGAHAPVPEDALRAMVATVVRDTIQAEFAQALAPSPTNARPSGAGASGGGDHDGGCAGDSASDERAAGGVE
jgi:hypothetical protein